MHFAVSMRSCWFHLTMGADFIITTDLEALLWLLAVADHYPKPE